MNLGGMCSIIWLFVAKICAEPIVKQRMRTMIPPIMLSVRDVRLQRSNKAHTLKASCSHGSKRMIKSMLFFAKSRLTSVLKCLELPNQMPENF